MRIIATVYWSDAPCGVMHCECLHASNDLYDGKFDDQGRPKTKSG